MIKPSRTVLFSLCSAAIIRCSSYSSRTKTEPCILDEASPNVLSEGNMTSGILHSVLLAINLSMVLFFPGFLNRRIYIIPLVSCHCF